MHIFLPIYNTHFLTVVMLPYYILVYWSTTLCCPLFVYISLLQSMMLAYHYEVWVFIWIWRLRYTYNRVYSFGMKVSYCHQNVILLIYIHVNISHRDMSTTSSTGMGALQCSEIMNVTRQQSRRRQTPFNTFQHL